LIEAGNLKFKAELNDKSSPETFKKLLDSLPFESVAEIRGEEIYFTSPFAFSVENATLEMDVGDIAFWPDGPAIAIFFGKTPISSGEKPVPYSPCNKIGKLADVTADKKGLLQIKAGDKVIVKKD